MYETFYHLSANPFRLAPDPRFCFEHAGHSEARAYLSYALKLGEGFIVITGRPGTGKTTLVQTFLKELELPRVLARSIAASNLEAAELLRAVAYAFDIEIEATDKATLRRRIQQFFARQVKSGNRVLLIIDEAQGLPQAALEELRLLADLQTGSSPLLQLFLVGQEKLRELMHAPAMEQFQQRVIGAFRLEPLGVEETRAYVEHRLRRADWKGDPELTGAALLCIHRYSGGVPRHINKVCTRLFLHGLMNKRRRLDAEDVLAISAELCDEQLAPLGTVRSDLSPAAVADAGNGSLCLDKLAVRYEAPPRAEARTAARAQCPAPRAAAVASPPGCFTEPKRQRRLSVDAIRVAARRLGSETLQALVAFNGAENRLVPLAILTLVAAVVFSGFRGEDRGEQGYLFAEQPEPAARRIARSPDSAPGSGESNRDLPRPVAAEVGSRAATGGREAASRAEADHTGPAGVFGHAATAAPAGVTGAGLAGARERAEQNPIDFRPGADSALASLSVSQGADDPPEPENPTPPVRGEPQIGSAPAAATTAVAAVRRSDPGSSRARVAEPPHGTAQGGAAAALSREAQVAELLTRGHRALARDRLLVPGQDNAYGYYRQVLALQPDNRAAIAGMSRIADRYVVLVKRALARQDEEKARLYIRRGLRVQPDDPRLELLQGRADSRRRAALEARVAPQGEAPAVKAEPEDESRGFLSRLRDLFTGRQVSQGD
jgi:type II secretory pathway predicted ATPase ExeA